MSTFSNVENVLATFLGELPKSTGTGDCEFFAKIPVEMTLSLDEKFT